MDFEKGDVVALRSGGPKMTVRKIAMQLLGRTLVWCTWFEKGKKADAAFDPEMLERQIRSDAARA
jgi:uncharacterized protein YodC (DUF2158 family)